jgi:hypothetical protein
MRTRLVLVLAVLLVAGAGIFGLVSKFSGQPQLWTAPQGEVQWFAQDVVEKEIVVYVGTSRATGYRIGETMPVRIRIIAPDSVKIDLSLLAGGTVSLDSTPFEMAGRPEIRQWRSDGKQVYEVDLAVRAFSVKPELAFTATFLYAKETLENGKPKWVNRTTPRMTFSTTRSSAEEDQLLPGNREPWRQPASQLGPAMIAAGGALLLVMIAPMCFALFRRRPRVFIPSDGKLAWTTFDRIAAEASQSGGWDKEHLKNLSGALRRYWHAESVPTSKLPEMYSAEMDLTIQLLRRLDQVVYGDQVLREAEQRELLSKLERIVPRPAAA